MMATEDPGKCSESRDHTISISGDCQVIFQYELCSVNGTDTLIITLLFSSDCAIIISCLRDAVKSNMPYHGFRCHFDE